MEFLTVKQVAEKLSLSEYTVRLKISKGVIKGYKRGRLWYVLPEDVDKYVLGS